MTRTHRWPYRPCFFSDPSKQVFSFSGRVSVYLSPSPSRGRKARKFRFMISRFLFSTPAFARASFGFCVFHFPLPLSSGSIHLAKSRRQKFSNNKSSNIFSSVNRKKISFLSLDLDVVLLYNSLKLCKKSPRSKKKKRPENFQISKSVKLCKKKRKVQDPKNKTSRNFKISKFQNFKISKFPNFQISKFLNFKIPKAL